MTIGWFKRLETFQTFEVPQNINTIFIKFEDLVFDQENTFIYILNKLKKFTNLEIDQKKIENIVKTTKFKHLRQLEEKEGFIENKIMGIQNNDRFFFNKGGEQNFNKDLDQNIIDKIESSATEWISPIVMVPKPKSPGEYRLCVDMVKPNKAIKRVRHVIPTIDEMRHDYNGSMIFTKLDLNPSNFYTC